MKVGLRTLKQAQLTLEERACLGTLLASTWFSDPAGIPHLVYSLEESRPELSAWAIDPDAFLRKIKALDTAALYALVDLLERNITLGELA